MVRRVVAVLACITIGMSIGGVLHARDRIEDVRTCEELDPEHMVCDDDTSCEMINGIWYCRPDSPAALH